MKILSVAQLAHSDMRGTYKTNKKTGSKPGERLYFTLNDVFSKENRRLNRELGLHCANMTRPKTNMCD
tara:strand:- start:2190 stop:2393 length:204 start_codon:yes stop_codon:yes gene_type:complete